VNIPSKSGNRQRELAVSPPLPLLLQQATGTLLHRPLRLLQEQPATATQQQVESREDRGGGLHPPLRSKVARREHLAQPPVVPSR
jgi:hypothetical protein